MTICWTKWYEVKFWVKLIMLHTYSVLLSPKLTELQLWQNQPPPAPYGVWLKIAVFYSYLWGAALQFRQHVLTICWPKWYEVKVWLRLTILHTYSVLLSPKLTELQFWQNQPPPAPHGVWLKIAIFYSHLCEVTLRFGQQLLPICWPKSYEVKVWFKLNILHTHGVLLSSKLTELQLWQNQPSPAPYGVYSPLRGLWPSNFTYCQFR